MSLLLIADIIFLFLLATPPPGSSISIESKEQGFASFLVFGFMESEGK
jgi:hypothetical protein